MVFGFGDLSNNSQYTPGQKVVKNGISYTVSPSGDLIQDIGQNITADPVTLGGLISKNLAGETLTEDETKTLRSSRTTGGINQEALQAYDNQKLAETMQALGQGTIGTGTNGITTGEFTGGNLADLLGQISGQSTLAPATQMAIASPDTRQLPQYGTTSTGDPISGNTSLQAIFGQQPTGEQGPLSYQDVARQSFQAVVDPMKRQYEKDVSTLMENLSTRGIAYGQLGTENIKDMLGRQQELYGQVAKSIGAELGGQALTQQYALQQMGQADQFNRQKMAVQLALSGNLSGEGVDQIIQQTFGPGTTLSTQDEVDLRRVAMASGLTDDEFALMKRAIGQGQLLEVMKNPQSFVDSPEKARQFQVQLAKMAQGAALSAASQQSDAAMYSSIFSTVGTMATAVASDRRLKDDIKEIDDDSALAVLSMLRPVSFQWKPELGKGNERQYGLIAQEVEPILPDVVVDNEGEYKKVKYNDIFSILIKAVQVLANKVKELEKNG